MSDWCWCCIAAGILPIGNGQDGAAGTHRKRHSGSDRRLNHHGSGERQGAGNAAGDLCGRRDGGRDCGRFSVEAIRAQAVAARTYAVYKQSRGRPAEHPDADVCDDYSHCAAYQPDAVKTFSTGYSRIRKAVKDTAGQILTCDGAPIAAVFHCVSGPKTESAADVSGRGYSVSAKRGQSGRHAVRRIRERGDANGGCVPRKRSRRLCQKRM